MAKSSIADILEVQRLISKLDKRGKLAILRDLQKQNLEPTLLEEMRKRYYTKESVTEQHPLSSKARPETRRITCDGTKMSTFQIIPRKQEIESLLI